MPNWGEAYVPNEKSTGYLLSESRALGKWKADFFKTLGFTKDQADVLEEKLLEIARTNDVRSQIQTEYGTNILLTVIS